MCYQPFSSPGYDEPLHHGDYQRARDHGRTRDPGRSPKKEFSFITTIWKAMDSVKNAGRSKTPPTIYQPGRGPSITLPPTAKQEDTRNQPASSSHGDRNGSRDTDVYQIRAPPLGSYQDDDTGPSPKNLVMAVMGVKNAVYCFAKALISDMNKYPEELRHLEQRIRQEVQGEVERPNHWKFLVQAFVCKRLFEGFETENGFFGIEYFDGLRMSSVSSFNDFFKFKDKAATISGLLSKDSADLSFLGKYCFKKFMSVTGELDNNQPLRLYEDEWSWVERERHPQSEFYQSFLKVAVSVWLLHRLVHSCGQGWKMLGWGTFPVGSEFQSMKMESVENDETRLMSAVVGFLVIPGFQVSKSVVKCGVYLRNKTCLNGVKIMEGSEVTPCEKTSEKKFSDKEPGSLLTPDSLKSSSNCSGHLRRAGDDPETEVWDFAIVGYAGSVAKLESYFKVAEESIEALRKMSKSMKFNNLQCGYLAEKLIDVVQKARSFLEVYSRGGLGEPFSFEEISRLSEIFKLLVGLAKRTESFVQACCKDAWVQAAITLTNVSEYVSSLGFNLELCRVAFGTDCAASGCLTLDEVDAINKAEAELVEKKASADARLLLEKVISELNSLHGEDRDLASYLLQRLLRFNLSPTSDIGVFLSTLFAWVESAEQVGRGASATVYKAMWLGTPVAKKTFKGSQNVEFDKEVEILSRLCHPNITSMFCCSKNKRNCSIIMELMDGDLDQLMERRCEGCEGSGSPPFPILEAVDIMLQIGQGVNYLHNQGIVHRDLKSKNILYKNMKAENFEIGYVHAKVADFGISKARDRSTTYSNLTLNTGTNRWMPPEIIGLSIRNQGCLLQSTSELPKHPFKLDTYSFGMVCYEILTGHEPFSDCSNPNDIKRRIMNSERPALPSKPSDCPPKLKTFIENCWAQEPKERPTFAVICAELRYLKYLLMTGEMKKHASI